MKSKLGFTRTIATLVLCGAASLYGPRDARAFCGFYVGKADAGLYNHASQVVMVRHDDKTVISLMNDYQGELNEFALVVPVPVVLRKEQVHIGDREIFTKLQAYSAPRLVEYFDPNPCAVMQGWRAMNAPAAGAASMAKERDEAKSLGVTVEAQYSVGEYEIVILSAQQSGGLETWLQQSGYKIPYGARRALEPYVRQNMKFFVAKVNLTEHKRTGLSYLRPLQFAFESPKFMLPIRLGMINAQGPQDLIIYMLTRNGRVETTNYRTVKLPSGMDLPEYVREDFSGFYKAMFDEQVKHDEMRTVFTEYAWNMGWCDPCAGPPLSREELRSLGVFWLDEINQPRRFGMGPSYRPIPGPLGGPVAVMLTRLHLRYTADTFPEDPVFQETQDTENFQARYVLHHAWDGTPDACPAAREYFDELSRRRASEAQTLADLTAWDLQGVMNKAGLTPSERPKPWWQGLWD
ncbi:MAG TPA: DUF2330 domain-containing protein [Candidatus Binataceae bacterium]